MSATAALAAASPQTSDGRAPMPRQRVTIRPITSADSRDLAAFYGSLSATARYARFLGTAVEVAGPMVQRFACVDHSVAEGFVAVLHEQGAADGSIVGHLCLEPDGTGGDELAVVVADGFRGHGIGKRLMGRALKWAKQRGVRHLTATMFATNGAMRRLMLDAGLQATSDDIDAGVESIELEMAA